MKFSEIKAGDWDKLWVRMEDRFWVIPCHRHREAMQQFETVREYLRSLSGGLGDMSAYSARSYFAQWRGGRQLVPTDEFRDSWQLKFTTDEIERVMVALRESLDSA